MEDLGKIEHEFEEKVKDIAEWVSKEIGKPAHEIAETLHSGFEKVFPHISEKTKLEMKKHLVGLGTPALGVYLAFSLTGGHPRPEIILPLALGGFLVGQIERKEIEEKIKKLEAKALEKLKKEVL